jgi:hypothetical protein
MKKLIKITFLLFFSNIWCQNSQGFVYNESLVGIEDVNISINNKVISTTDKAGNFTLNEHDKSEKISFSKSGYLTKEISGKNLKENNYKITLERIHEIEALVFNAKEYKKIKYDFALRKQANIRFIPSPNWEMGLKFNNDLGKRGIVSTVILFLHKTESDIKNTDVEINFYTIDSFTGKPKTQINKSKIIYTSSDKSRKHAVINVENLKIPFPLNGVFVSMKWLPNKFNDRKLGPSIRLTTSTDEKLTYNRYDKKEWSLKGGQKANSENFVNMMMGLEIYIKKTKNE